MIYEEVKEFIKKKVIITDIEGHIFRGIITNTESEVESASGKEEIEVDADGVIYGIPIDEVRHVMEIA